MGQSAIRGRREPKIRPGLLVRRRASGNMPNGYGQKCTTDGHNPMMLAERKTTCGYFQTEMARNTTAPVIATATDTSPSTSSFGRSISLLPLMKQCLPADVNLDYVVTIDELIQAVTQRAPRVLIDQSIAANVFSPARGFLEGGAPSPPGGGGMGETTRLSLLHVRRYR